MLTVLITLLATAPVAQDKGHPAEPIALPMTRQGWDAMTAEGRRRYARITVQALRRSPAFAKCDALTPDALESKIGELSEVGSPLMIGVAAAAYTMCEGQSG